MLSSELVIKNPKFVETLRKYENPSLNALIGLYKNSDYTLFKNVIKLGVFPPDAAGKLWAQCLGVTYVNPFQSVTVTRTQSALSFDISRKYCLIHLYSLSGTASVCMRDPRNRKTVMLIEGLLKRRVSPSFGLEENIEKSLDRLDPNIIESGQGPLLVQSEINQVFKTQKKKKRRTARIVFSETV